MKRLRLGRTGHAQLRQLIRRADGQSLVEFALVLPLLLLIVLIALDFGRVYLGYINVQNMARIAANDAANNPTAAWGDATDPAVVAYRNRILNDARAINCALPQVSGQAVVPPPAFADVGGNGTATDVGDTASVSVTCTFRVITPIISAIVGTGGNVPVSASAVFPVKSGLLATSGGIAVAPTAAFTGTPISGPAPLVVQFTDQSTGNPTGWAWDFESDGTVDSTAQDPVHTFASAGPYTVTLVASNGAGSDVEVRLNYITVGVPLAAVSFDPDPNTGVAPLGVQFTDLSTNGPISWAWDFQNDGVTDSTEQNPQFTYTAVGTYSVRLTVTNAGGTSSTLVANVITVSVGTCTVPNFAGLSSNDAQALWSGAGFSTTVQFQQGGRPWTIRSQSQVVGQDIPCNSPITLSRN